MALTTTYQLKTFADLVSAVREELKIQSTDTTALNRIKRDINITYIEEVVPFQQWKWLRGAFDATVYAAISAGTASVAQGSNTVTLTVPISSPKNGWLFGIVGYSEVYRIATHAANSSTIVLQAPYTGVTNATGSYKIWTDEIYLPSFIRETFEITHDFQDQALENCGLQKFRQYVASLPRAEGRPYFYTTNTYVDPVAYAVPAGLPATASRSSDGLTKTLTFASSVSNYLQQGDRIQISGSGETSYNGEFVISTQSGAVITYTGMIGVYETTASETAAIVQKLQPSSDSRRAKRVQVYPAVYTQNTTLHIDYIREVSGLADDTDEPLMPIGDRTVLLYGALHRAWSRERNPEEAKRNYDLFTVKLARMSGKMDDSIDQPRLIPNKIYLGAKRMAQRQRDTRSGLPEGWGGGNSGGTVVTGVANRAAKFDTTGTLAASTVTSTELGQLSGILSAAVGISDSQTLTNKTINAASNTITNITNTSIASNAAIARSKLASSTAFGVVLNDSAGAMNSSAPPLASGNVLISNGTNWVSSSSIGNFANKTLSNLSSSAFPNQDIFIINHDLIFKDNGSKGFIYDGVGTLSMAPSARALSNSQGSNSLDWSADQLFDNTANNNLSHDWTVRRLYNSSGNPVLDYATSGPILTLPKISGSNATNVIINSSLGVMTSTAALAPLLGGTGVASLTSSAVLIGNGTNPVSFVSPGTLGNVLISNGGSWVSSAAPVATFTAPTIQKFSSSAGTYIRPATVRYMRLVMVGAGGGGGGSGTTSGNGGNGAATTFSSLSAGGGFGGGGTGGEGGFGGTASLGSSAFGVAVSGGIGGPSVGGLAAFNEPGGLGAASALGGQGSIVRNTGTGNGGADNTGGGGGGSVAATGGASGAGGGSGAFIDALFIPSVASTAFAYVVGASGSSGTAGGSGFAGGPGGSGLIVVTEYYQ